VNLVQVLLSGGKLTTPHGTGYMPSFAGTYNDVELAAVANYVINHFGGKTGQVTADTVRARRLSETP
jgi:mono/diheme cytochrome c family protein